MTAGVPAKMIYLDYNATTPLCEAARAAMLPCLDQCFGNPSSVHAAGRLARAAIDQARDTLAGLLRVKPNELICTAGGTESNNLAVLGLARAQSAKGRHLISCRTEHHAVLHALEHLQKTEGFDVSWINVGSDGTIDLDHLRSSLRSETSLVSLMAANNETGALQPLREISEICHARGVLLHSDMVQSFAKIETDLSLVDAASFAAHKFYGPKGAGLLFLRSGLAIEPMIFGGAHENERRPGTENTAAIAGMAAAAAYAMNRIIEEGAREAELRDLLWSGISTAFPGVQQNGGSGNHLGNTLNVSFPGLDSETMLMALDLEGICASSGSACMVGSVVASHVLLAMGLSRDRAGSAIRFSLGRQTIAEEITEAVRKIGGLMQRLVRTKAKRQDYAVI